MSKFVTLHGFGGGTNSSDSVDLDQELNEQALLIQELEKTLKNKSMGDLNFEVVGGTVEPVNPIENTIWVNTDTEITSWAFSATQPAGEEGMVWFLTGMVNTVVFNVLEKNIINVYPLACKQYISDVWVDKTAKIYQNTEWVNWWNGELYNSGNQYEGITGGWEHKKYLSDGYGSDLVTFNASNMVIESHGSRGTVFAGAKSFDPAILANYTKFCVTFSLTRDDSAGKCRVGVAADYNIESATDFIAFETIELAGTYTKEVNISSINNGYPLVGVVNGIMTITKIWLE